jgi:hypothetical protein
MNGNNPRRDFLKTTIATPAFLAASDIDVMEFDSTGWAQ